MRYHGQNHELEVPTNVEAFTEEEVKRLLDAFHELHEARFGFRLADHIEIVNFLVTGIAKTGQLGFPEIVSAKVDAKPVTRRPVWFADGWIDTPVYARADLLQGHSVSGPALVEESASVTVLDPGKTMTVDRHGNLLLSN
jgi:N-methylhydantoinase A